MVKVGGTKQISISLHNGSLNFTISVFMDRLESQLGAQLEFDNTYFLLEKNSIVVGQLFVNFEINHNVKSLT